MKPDFKMEWGVWLVAALVTWLLVSLLIRLAPRIGLLDRPNERSLHTRVTPRGGGIGLVMALLGLAGWWLVSGRIEAELHSVVMIYLGAALFIAAVSLRDDFKSVGAGWRLLCHIGSAVVAVHFIGPMQVVALPAGLGEYDLGWMGPVFTVVWIVGLTNVYNFMDGIDGIAGVQGVVAGLAWSAAGWWYGLPAVALLGLALAGGCAGFLQHNWMPAKVFMGDVGSAFLGFCFAVLPLVALRELTWTGQTAGLGKVPGFALLAVWPFVGDGFFTFLQRLRKLEPVWKAHRSHLYQKLVRTGFTHAQVSLLYACWCVVCAATGLLWLIGARGTSVAAVSIPLFSLAGVFLLVVRRGNSGEFKNG